MNQHVRPRPASSPPYGPVEIATADGARLRGRAFLPAGEIERCVVIHGATGVPARYYEAFAGWLSATENAAVLIYDYRDFGWSLDGPVRASRASISDWALGDQSAALAHAFETFAGIPVEVIGHSLGALGLPWHERAGDVSFMTAVASGPAYWLDHPVRYLPKVLLFWWLAGPAATAAFGYLPGRRLGFGADLPAEVYWEWRRWCLSPDFNRTAWERRPAASGSVRCPVLIVGIEDDVVISPAMVRRLSRSFPEAQTAYRLVSPSALGLGPVGHIGVFHERNAKAWPLLRERAHPGGRPDLF